MQEIISIIGLVIFLGIMFGIILTAVYIAAVFFFQDHDINDDDDTEIDKHKF